MLTDLLPQISGVSWKAGSLGSTGPALPQDKNQRAPSLSPGRTAWHSWHTPEGGERLPQGGNPWSCPTQETRPPKPCGLAGGPQRDEGRRSQSLGGRACGTPVSLEGLTQDSGGLQAPKPLHGCNGLGQLFRCLQLPRRGVRRGQVAEPAQPVLRAESRVGGRGGARPTRRAPCPINTTPIPAPPEPTRHRLPLP